MRFYLENNKTQKRAGRVAPVVECLPSKHEVLNSNHSTTKKERKKEMDRRCPVCMKPWVQSQHHRKKSKERKKRNESEKGFKKLVRPNYMLLT
jgi:hypothetical protein